MSPDSQQLLLFEQRNSDQFSDVKTEDLGISPSVSKPQAQKWPAKFVFIQIVLIAVYTVVFFAATSLYTKGALSSHTSIQGLSIRHALVVFHNLTNNLYAGKPNDNIEAAWSDLMAPMHIRVTAHELALDNQESVALPEGGGYLGWLGAFHELHCIDMLRRWNYRDYYHPNVSGIEEQHMLSHVDHCFEMLRQSAVCHADLSLTTFTWHPEKARPMFNASESVHHCVNWSILMESISERVVTVDEIERLKNPLMI